MKVVGELVVPAIFGTLLAALILGVAPGVANAQQDSGTTVSVEVASTNPSANPSSAAPSPSGSASSGPSASASAAPTSGASVPVPSTSSSTGPGTGGGPNAEQSLGGVLYVSGLTWVYTPSWNPLAGTLDLHFTVRNVSTKPATGSAHMWLNGIFGVQVGQAVDVPVTDLKPGETRVVSGTIQALSQWTFVTASSTFNPPPELDGTKLTPLTRNTTVWYVPWFMLVVIAVLSVALYVVRHRRLAREAAEAIQDAADAAAQGTRP